MTRRSVAAVRQSPQSSPASAPPATGGKTAESTARIDLSNITTKKAQLALYIPPSSRRKNSPRHNLASPIQLTHALEIDTVDNAEDAEGGDGVEGEEEEGSDDVDDDNICLVCVGKCTCHKQNSEVESLQQLTRQKLKEEALSPQGRNLVDNVDTRQTRRIKSKSPVATTPTANGHSYGTRSHSKIIVRDGRGPGRHSDSKPRRPSDPKSDFTMDISDIDLDDEQASSEDESEDDDESDDLGDTGDDLDIEGEEERAIIEEESRRLRQNFSPSDDEDDEDADFEEEEDEEDEDLDQESIFQEKQYSSSESSPDEDHEFFQNDFYISHIDPSTMPSTISNKYKSTSPGIRATDVMVYENPLLRALIDDPQVSTFSGLGSWIDEDEADRVGWECFVDDTDVDMGDDLYYGDDDSTRFGGGDTTDEEDFQRLVNPAASPAPKRKHKRANDLVLDVVTTAHRPPPLATWERDGDEITIIDALPFSFQSPFPSPQVEDIAEMSPSQDILHLEEFFDASLLVNIPDEAAISDASSTYTLTRPRSSRSRKDSSATAASFNTNDTFVTPAPRGRARKVPIGSYRRQVLLSERSLEAREKSVVLKEWYTLQERRNLRQLSKSHNAIQTPRVTQDPVFGNVDSSPSSRGRRRSKLRTARRARRESGEFDLRSIKRRRTSDGVSTAAFMERLGLEEGDIEEEEEEESDEENEFEEGERGIVNGVGERMVLDDDLELAQFIVAPPGGIDLSPLFGAIS